jgi:uncharacterized protein YjbJ (UPF0337 family)
MNQAQLKGKWEQIKGSAKKVWGDLTDDDFTKAQGSAEKLYGIIHEKYGDTKESIMAKMEKLQDRRDASSKEAESNSGKREAQLAQLGARLDEMVAKAEKMGADAKADYHKRIDELKEKYRATQAKLTELKNAGKEKLEALEEGVEKAWKDLEAAFKKITNHN